MADKKSILARIKQIFDDQTLPTSYKLADGTDVTISLLDVGGDFAIGGAPAPEGTYTLIDGTNITVDSTGKITALDAPQDMSATEYTLKDGTKVSIDKMDVGGKVMQGEQPIANGEYTLQDGSKITTVDGAITVVTPAPSQQAAAVTQDDVQAAYDTITNAAPDAQMAGVVACIKALMNYCFGWQMKNPTYDAQAEAESAQNLADAITAVGAMSAQFSTKDTEINTLKIALSKQEEKITRQDDTIKQMLELMTQLAEAPSGDPPPQERKVIFSGQKPASKKTALERYAAAAEKLATENV